MTSKHDHLRLAALAAFLVPVVACGGGAGTEDPTGAAASAEENATQDVALDEGAGAEDDGASETRGDGAPPPADAPFEVSAEAEPTAQAELLARLGLPARFAVGLGNDAYASQDPTQVAAYGLGPKLDIHYMYLSGLDWMSWTPVPGDYVREHAEAAQARGVVPMFTLYQGAAWGEAQLGNFANASYMTKYWEGARTMFEKLGAFDAPAVVHLEPDLWGYTQKKHGNDPSKVPMKVGSIVPECRDLPEDVAGFGKCLVRLSRTLSPKVAVGLSASTFGAKTATAVATYLDAVGGAEADLVVMETLDRDAGCFEVGSDPRCKRKGKFIWDETNQTHPSFHDHLAWSRTIHQVTGKPLLWWQMPLGVPSGAPGSAGRYRDNRVRYVFTHPEEFVAAGGIGAVFGTGAPNQTTTLTDGGQFANAVAGYLAAPVPVL